MSIKKPKNVERENEHKSSLECFVNQRVKVVFKDGDQIKVKYGTLISAADGFATLKTDYGTCAVNITEIIRIQTKGEE